MKDGCSTENAQHKPFSQNRGSLGVGKPQSLIEVSLICQPSTIIRLGGCFFKWRMLPASDLKEIINKGCLEANPGLLKI